MIRQYKYSEERLVYADIASVWDLLSNCNYLPNWMPYIIRVEHLGNTHLQKGSVLWVESLIDKKKNQSICYVSACEENREISFLSAQNGAEVCFSFKIKTEENGLIKILMIVEISLDWYRKILFRNSFIQSIKTSAWIQLNQLDKAITEYRSQGKHK